MITRQQLKKKAKESLSNKWGDAIVITILYYIPFIILSSIFSLIFKPYNIIDINDISSMTNISVSAPTEFIEYFFNIIIVSLLLFGFRSFFLKISRNEKVEINELWSKINWFLPCVCAILLVSIFTFLWSLLLIIPGIIASYSYQMTYYVMLDNPDIGVMEAIKESKRLMKGHKMDLFILQLSFLGWYLLGAITCGLLYIWVIPYSTTTICNFYNNIKELKKIS